VSGTGLEVSLPCLPTAEALPSAEEMKKLMWLFGCPLLLDDVAQESWLLPSPNDLLLEVGPRYVSHPVPHSKAHLSFCTLTGHCFCFHSSPLCAYTHTQWALVSSIGEGYTGTSLVTRQGVRNILLSLGDLLFLCSILFPA
jgi:hypothetical protein